MTRNIRTFLLLLALASAIQACNKETGGKGAPVEDNSTVYGYVTANGRGLAGVVVSDGNLVTVTDEDGCYRLESEKPFGSVFVSVPSGYEALAPDGLLPEFSARLTKDASVREKIDFKLKSVDQSRYRMLVFGDIHLADRKFTDDIAQFRRFADEINDLTATSDIPVYALTLGDMSWDVFWKSNNYGLKEYLAEARRDLDSLTVYHTMGNHDNDPEKSGDRAGSSTYEATVCPNHYSFNVGKVHYVVLDNILYKNENPGTRDFNATVTTQQLNWLSRDLSHVDRSTPVVVAMHIPIYNENGSNYLYNMSEFINCFKGFDYVQVLTGHRHTVYVNDMLSRSIHTIETVSGAVCGSLWMTETACKSGMNLCSDGAPGGYRILDVDGASIKWRYKGTECPEDLQFRTYDRNMICLDFLPSAGDYAVKSTSNEVLINVWDYDPSWNISVTENGKPLEVKRLSNAYDPLYLAVYEAYEYRHGYTISYPSSKTDHIFSVTASTPVSTLDITVTDRFGRIYSETMKRPKAFYQSPD